MPDFKFIRIPNLETWVVNAPRRAARPKQFGKHKILSCPFCPGNEKREREVYRIGGEDDDAKWSVRVLKNRYPFAPIHELVVLTPHHTRHFSDLPLDQIKLGLEAFVNRFNAHIKKVRSASLVIQDEMLEKASTIPMRSLQSCHGTFRWSCRA